MIIEPDITKPAQMTISPWKLSAAEAKAMDAVCLAGCQKLAARRMGWSVNYIKALCKIGGRKIHPSCRVSRYVKWSLWRHGVQPEAMSAPFTAGIKPTRPTTAHAAHNPFNQGAHA